MLPSFWNKSNPFALAALIVATAVLTLSIVRWLDRPDSDTQPPSLAAGAEAGGAVSDTVLPDARAVGRDVAVSSDHWHPPAVSSQPPTSGRSTRRSDDPMFRPSLGVTQAVVPTENHTTTIPKQPIGPRQANWNREDHFDASGPEPIILEPYTSPATSDSRPQLDDATSSQSSLELTQPGWNGSDFKPADQPADLPQATGQPEARLAKLNSPQVGKQASELPHVLQGSKNFKLAEQPAMGAHFKDETPIVDQRAAILPAIESDFSPGPSYDGRPYMGHEEARIYEGKGFYANQRPLVELGRPWYQLGPLDPGLDWFGKHNNIVPQFLVYGDYRTTVASNKANGDSTSLIASELNLDLDLKLTGTERFHAFVSPLDNGLQNTRYLLDEDRVVGELDANFDFGYFEGDLGAMAGGFLGETLPFDMPFAIGVMPLLFQNGVWMEDAFLGVATTIPARNSARFNISNMDITFFAGYDKISSDAFPGDDSAARMYGMAAFIEALNGYFEIDYAFLDDRTFDDRSYHNIGLAYSRRFGRFVSNSTRVIINTGQSTDQVENTADGVLLLSENSLITGSPSSLVPYFNLWAGFDRPQSAARAVQAGGVLRNTGILFESDGMTNYPTLDPTANDTYGGAFGINLIADDFSQQLVVETAMLGVMGNDATRNAPGEQLGLGFRYQLPLSNAVIFRADGMYGFLKDQPDVRGLRFELRQKW